MVALGEVWRHQQYYADEETGEMLPKYLVVLAVRPDGDIVYRLLTSQPYDRPEVPACDKGGARPSYFFGIPQPAGPLNKPTWLDLRELEDDFDARDFDALVKKSLVTRVHQFTSAELCPALHCAAYAPDTLKSQTKHIMNARATLGCT